MAIDTITADQRYQGIVIINKGGNTYIPIFYLANKKSRFSFESDVEKGETSDGHLIFASKWSKKTQDWPGINSIAEKIISEKAWYKI